MADYGLSAAGAIRDFLWSKLITTPSNVKTNKMMFDPTDYQIDLLSGTEFTMIPIIPSQQDALLDGALADRNHIIYDYVADGYEDNWLICRDSMMFTVYSKSYAEIAEIQNLMLDLFRRMDDTATDINAYIGNNSPFIFFSVSLIDLLSPEPEREKVGWQAGQIVIKYKYGRQVSPTTGRFA
jgi:hypothetical protein